MMAKKRAKYLTYVAVLSLTGTIMGITEADAAKKEEKVKEPVTVVADSMYYSDATGAVEASGEVEVSQGTKEITTESLDGNVKQEQYRAPGEVHLKDKNGQDLTGAGLSYNAKIKSASFDVVEGTYPPFYVRGRGGVFENNVGTVQYGMVTTPSAMAFVHTPDYRVEGRDITIYPGDKVVVKDATFYIKNWRVLRLASYTTSLRKGKGGASIASFLPKPTYDSDHGIGLHGDFRYPIGKHTDFFIDYYLYSKAGFKPSVGFKQYMSWGEASIGYIEEEGTLNDENIWIKKKPEFRIDTKQFSLGKTPFNVKFGGSLGRWEEGSTKGSHNMWYGELSHNPISLGSKGDMTFLVGYRKDHYGVNDSNRSMPYWGAKINYNPSKKLGLWFNYTQKNGNIVSPYVFDTDSITKRAVMGFRWNIDRLNGVGVEVTQDWETGDVRYVNYSYYRDLHSFTAKITYREKQKDWRISIRAKDF